MSIINESADRELSPGMQVPILCEGKGRSQEHERRLSGGGVGSDAGRSCTESRACKGKILQRGE